MKAFIGNSVANAWGKTSQIWKSITGTVQTDGKVALDVALGSNITKDNADGTQSVSTVGSITDDYRGTYPVFQPLPFSGLAPDTSDASIVYESGDISAHNKHEFSSYIGTAADSLSVLIMHLGQTAYEDTPVQVIDRSLVAGAAVQSSADVKAVGNYSLNGQFKSIKILQNGAAISVAYGVRGTHEVA